MAPSLTGNHLNATRRRRKWDLERLPLRWIKMDTVHWSERYFGVMWCHCVLAVLRLSSISITSNSPVLYIQLGILVAQQSVRFHFLEKVPEPLSNRNLWLYFSLIDTKCNKCFHAPSRPPFMHSMFYTLTWVSVSWHSWSVCQVFYDPTAADWSCPISATVHL